jgi:peptidoglycan-N-acetylglucosamine deacetylase
VRAQVGGCLTCPSRDPAGIRKSGGVGRSKVFARSGDVARLEGGFEFGRPTEIVEIPVSWSWDDFPQFEFVSAPTFSANALASPSKVFEIWSADIAYMVHRVPDGVFDLTMHPQVMGRGHRIMLLENVIEHCRKYPSLRFARAGEVAEEYRARMGGAEGTLDRPAG